MLLYSNNLSQALTGHELDPAIAPATMSYGEGEWAQYHPDSCPKQASTSGK
jgi:hypothetical protein